MAPGKRAGKSLGKRKRRRQEEEGSGGGEDVGWKRGAKFTQEKKRMQTLKTARAEAIVLK